MHVGQDRNPHALRTLLRLCGAGFATVCFLGCEGRYAHPEREDLRPLEKLCEPVIRFAEQHYADTGGYPAELPPDLRHPLDKSPVPVLYETEASRTTLRRPHRPVRQEWLGRQLHVCGRQAQPVDL